MEIRDLELDKSLIVWLMKRGFIIEEASVIVTYIKRENSLCTGIVKYFQEE